MICEKSKVYFISLKVGKNIHEIASLVTTHILDGESFNKVAKTLRKEFVKYYANHGLPKGIKESQIDWAVYTVRISNENDEYYFPGVRVYEILCSSDETIFPQEISKG